MKLVNLTPHNVTIEQQDTPRMESRWTIPASGRVARCAVTSRSLGAVYFETDAACGHVHVTTSELGAVADLPEPSDGVAYIVSRIVAEACPTRSDLYFPGEAIRDVGGRIVGCRGLCRIGGTL